MNNFWFLSWALRPPCHQTPTLPLLWRKLETFTLSECCLRIFSIFIKNYSACPSLSSQHFIMWGQTDLGTRQMGTSGWGKNGLLQFQNTHIWFIVLFMDSILGMRQQHEENIVRLFVRFHQNMKSNVNMARHHQVAVHCYQSYYTQLNEEFSQFSILMIHWYIFHISCPLTGGGVQCAPLSVAGAAVHILQPSRDK